MIFTNLTCYCTISWCICIKYKANISIINCSRSVWVFIDYLCINLISCSITWCCNIFCFVREFWIPIVEYLCIVFINCDYSLNFVLKVSVIVLSALQYIDKFNLFAFDLTICCCVESKSYITRIWLWCCWVFNNFRIICVNCVESFVISW